MTTLTEFLLARITDDEAVATAAREEWENDRDEWRLGCTEETAAHIARWDVPRVLAECEAKRRIASLFATTLADEMDAAVGKWNEAAWKGTQAIRTLALPYADHPDYQDEWRP